MTSIIALLAIAIAIMILRRTWKSAFSISFSIERIPASSTPKMLS